MKKLILILGLALLIPARASWAQVAAPNNAGRIHGPRAFYGAGRGGRQKVLDGDGGRPRQTGTERRVQIPWRPDPGAKRRTARLPSVGSVVGHIGFHVPDTNAAMARWKAAGLETEAGQNPGQGFVWTPDKMMQGRDSGRQDTNRSHRVSPRAFLHRGHAPALRMCWRCNPGTPRCSAPSRGNEANSTPRTCPA